MDDVDEDKPTQSLETYLDQVDFSYIYNLYNEYIKNFDQQSNYEESARFFQMAQNGRYIIGQSYAFIQAHPHRMKCFQQVLDDLLSQTSKVTCENDLYEVVLTLIPDYPFDKVQKCFSTCKAQHLYSLYLRFEKTFQAIEDFQKNTISAQQVIDICQFDTKILRQYMSQQQFQINNILNDVYNESKNN